MSAFKVNSTMQKNTKILTNIHHQREMNRAIIRIVENHFHDSINEFINWFNSHDDEKFGLASEGIEYFQGDIKHWQSVLNHNDARFSDNNIQNAIDDEQNAIYNFKHIPNTAWCILRKDGVTGMLRPLDIVAIIGTLKYHTKDWNLKYFEDAMKHYKKYQPLLKHLTAPLTFREATMN